MKKLKLKVQELSSAEVLTRSQLKNVFGGVSTTAENCEHCGGVTGISCPSTQICQSDNCSIYGGHSCLAA